MYHSLFVVKLPYWLLLSILTKIKGPPCSPHSRSPVFKTKPEAQGPAPFPWPRPLSVRGRSVAHAQSAPDPALAGFMKTLGGGTWGSEERKAVCKVC